MNDQTKAERKRLQDEAHAVNPILCDATCGHETTNTIHLQVNYQAIHERFRTDAMFHLARFANERQKTFTRKEVYDFVASLRIALGAMTKEAEIYELRNGIDAAAELMFAVVNKEQED